jgi:large subunit ribosomal protein L23
MNAEHLYKVVLAPHVSEKASMAAELSNQAVFKVAMTATKPEIKKAVEKLFDVKVKAVQVLVVKGKAKRNRYGLVKKPSWKKAYVTLEEGQDIDLAIAG